jgi:hypothetical protein
MNTNVDMYFEGNSLCIDVSKKISKAKSKEKYDMLLILVYFFHKTYSIWDN